MKTVLTYNDLLSKVAALEESLRSKDEDIKRYEERIAYLERLLFGEQA